MNPNLESMLDPERLAQPLPGAIYLASPYTAQDPGVEQARVQASSTSPAGSSERDR